MKELETYRERMVRRWQAVVQHLEEAAAHIPPETWRAAPASGGMTCHQALAYLHDMEAQVIAPSIRILLAGEQTPLPPCPDMSAWLAQYRPGEAPQDILRAYARLREEEAALLFGRGEPPWSAQARHPRFGVRTLQWWVEASLLHARRQLRFLRRQAPAE